MEDLSKNEPRSTDPDRLCCPLLPKFFHSFATWSVRLMKSLIFLLSRSFSSAFTSTFSGSLAKGLKVDLTDLKPEAKDPDDDDPGFTPEDKSSVFNASLRSVLRNLDLNAAGWYEDKSSEALSPILWNEWQFTTWVDYTNESGRKYWKGRALPIFQKWKQKESCFFAKVQHR